jgi:ankyrin repeat protein
MRTRRTWLLGLLATFIAFSAKAGVYEDFFRAVHADDVATVQKLLARGVDPNWPNEKGVPALILSIQLETAKMPLLLISQPQIQLEAQTTDGETALMMAAFLNRLDVAEALIERGAEVNRKGWTALHYAATKGHIAMMRLLLEHNAYIDAEAPNGNTPLMMAAQFAPPLATKLLLEEGADPNLVNNLQRSALDLALMNDRQQTAFYIRAFLEAWEVNERAQQETPKD